MKIVAGFVSDRGDKHLPTCLESFWQNVDPALVAEAYTVDDQEHKLGLAGAVRETWGIALDLGADYLFHVEEDWTFNRRIDIAGMVRILEKSPHLSQVVLKRGIEPRNAHEVEAGGWMEHNPTAYADERFLTSGETWVEHQVNFSLNPCLIPRRVLELGWDDDNEAGTTKQLLAAGFSFAIWGRFADPPAILHHGLVRGYGWRP